ncbi:DUF1648 domain-containing protein [Actinomyces sp.]|uniref:DUF1648 domain-containing protein n=1 Tax=Actinomyces sp. TaxID=29317 RepID=UPI0026DDAB3D|nr:DUF1648 domain-containing protein [Actinomyces sp.]MDO4901241.1 DUF1648 domain-containing protein [Actinomyces sp.]
MLAYTIIMILMTVVLGLAFWATPAISRDTLPLGVSVPAERVRDPVVLRAIRTWHGCCLVGATVAVAAIALLHLSGITASRPGLPVIIMLAQLGAGFASWTVVRLPIIEAKRQEGWYEGKRVRKLAPIGSAEESTNSAPWYFVSALLLLVTAVLVLLRYDSLPDPLPIHWGADGTVDGWARRTPLQVLLPAAIGLVLVAVVALCTSIVRRRSLASIPVDGDRGRTRRLARAQAHLLDRVMGPLALAVGVSFAGILVLPLVKSPAAARWWIAITVMAICLLILWMIADLIRLSHRFARRLTPVDADSPDDDELWFGGLFYVNRADPSLLVPKRAGVGVDLNYGHPIGRALAVFILIDLIVTIGVCMLL